MYTVYRVLGIYKSKDIIKLNRSIYMYMYPMCNLNTCMCISLIFVYSTLISVTFLFKKLTNFGRNTI